MDNKNDKITVYKMEAVDRIDYSEEEYAEEKMLIGFFDSLATCADVEGDYRLLPGFSLPSCRFVMTPYYFSCIKNNTINRVYFVQEWIFDEQSGEEAITEIGVFATIEEAEKQIAQYRAFKTPGITDQTTCNDSIYIDEYRINERHWQEGFTREGS